MKQLITRHYQAIRNRGMIDENTLITDFWSKVNEECQELKDSLYSDIYQRLNSISEHSIQESIDLAMVVLNMLQYYDVDIEKELLKNIELQEKRANEAKQLK